VSRAVGVDVGATKTLAGLVDLASHTVVRTLRWPTPVAEGGRAVLDRCVAAAAELAPGGAPVGIGLCEYVDRDGRQVGAQTLDWRGLDLAEAFSGVGPAVLESDVRAAARAEAVAGAGRGHRVVLYVSVGTGISHCLLQDGRPYLGAHGFAITTGAPPVEQLASGSALARRAGLASAHEVLASPAHAAFVRDAASALGLAVAALVNALDPDVVVIGGGLGRVAGYRDLLIEAALPAIDLPGGRELGMLCAALGDDGPVLGSALATSTEEELA
jgi:glucokinase